MLKKQNGITLIALIITIIVMLILVGVTINVALNGGLFEKAEIATKETEEKAILEEMISIMEITDDGKINAQGIIEKMKEKYTVEGGIPNITITGKLGKYNYILSEKTIKIGKEEGEDLGEYYLNLLKMMYGIVEGANEEQVDDAFNEFAKLAEQGLVCCFEYSIDDGDYMMCYYQINGYNYYVYKDNTGDAPIMTISLLTKGSDESNKVNSLVEESKSVEAELNTLLIGTGYTYTNDEGTTKATATYVANNLSETRTVTSIWSSGDIKLEIGSIVDNRYTLEYNIKPTAYGTSSYTPQSIANLNVSF